MFKQLCSWDNSGFFSGPPGTGKTSLCKGLAQKLCIRLSDRFSYGQLIEINSHSLFSKWFSEVIINYLILTVSYCISYCFWSVFRWLQQTLAFVHYGQHLRFVAHT